MGLQRRRKGKGGGTASITGSAAASWEVLWHAKAKEEHRDIEQAGDRVAIQHVIEKLKVDGVQLRDPHRKAIMGPAGAGLRELRPNSGRCPWRPIYKQFGERRFVILAVGPEAEVDKQGFDNAVSHAQDRVPGVEKSLSSEKKK